MYLMIETKLDTNTSILKNNIHTDELEELVWEE